MPLCARKGQFAYSRKCDDDDDDDGGDDDDDDDDSKNKYDNVCTFRILDCLN